MALDLSMLLQPIPAGMVVVDHLKPFGLGHLARKLDSIPLPCLSSLNTGYTGNTTDVLSSTYGDVSDSFRRSDHYSDVGDRCCYNQLSQSGTFSRSCALKSSSGAVISSPLSVLAELYIPEVSILSQSGLFGSIPDDIYHSGLTSDSSPHGISVPGSVRHESDGDLNRRSLSPVRGTSRSVSPARARGSGRGGRQSRRGDSKVSRSARSVVTEPEPSPTPVTTVENWAQCESCKKWRRLPASVNTDQLPDLWVCSLNVWDPHRSSCDVPEEVFPEVSLDTSLAALPEPAPEVPVVEEKLILPIRPVVGHRGRGERFMDHEVVEMLFSGNRKHPLFNRVTIHSLDKNSLLATELPHDVLMVEDNPSSAVMGLTTAVGMDPNDFLRPEDDLLKEENMPRVDGVLSIGYAMKTNWPSQDHDASTVDSFEDTDISRVPVSILASVFPKLALQVPSFSGLLPGRSKRTVVNPKPPEFPVDPLPTHSVPDDSTALSCMTHEDLGGVLSVFGERESKVIPKVHCRLEEKLRQSTLPLDTFLQPLSMLSVPIKDSSSEPLAYTDLESDSTLQKLPQGDQQLRKLRDDYLKGSTGRGYTKRGTPYVDEGDYVPKRQSRRQPQTVAPSTLRAPVEAFSNPINTMLLMELSTPIDYVPPAEVSGMDGSFSSSHALELLTQPIDMGSLVIPSQ
ncbi:CW-type Zinc Finger family protein [Babesia bovis T2Bo]|uniref:CW-type zinc finger family protein n=1 Tax=Babesia bovis TaxID=5865 RepID=A7AMX7_BABBO|nr:CW-type Zinc Finger family protein [Babesia bovis T2Bo]EDO07911.1 CW-type Zinc Finger family protein [Babesia bovis T2Bo]|eukprot:XP_001611479.1 CW-type zinc finger family protein [Babesia bovis T2Bo]